MSLCPYAIAHAYTSVLLYERHTLVPQCQLVKRKCSLRIVHRVGCYEMPAPILHQTASMVNKLTICPTHTHTHTDTPTKS